MTQSSIHHDIAFARDMAEAGATSPSLGGRYYVLWGMLTAIAALVHWATLSGYMPFSIAQIGWVWLSITLTGWVGTFLLARGMANKPGQSSPGNKAGNGFWIAAGIGFFAIWAGIIAAVVFRNQPPLLFDIILPMAFVLYAVAGSVSASLTRPRTGRFEAGLSLAFAAMTMAFVGSPTLYLVSAVGILLVLVVPGILRLRREPSSVV